MLATSGSSILKGLQPGQEMTLAGDVIRTKAVKPEMTPTKVEMIKTAPGSVDGININDYQEGQVYSLPEGLANSFYSMKVAKPYKEPEPKVKRDIDVDVKPDVELEAKPEVNKKPSPVANKATRPKLNKQKQGA